MSVSNEDAFRLIAKELFQAFRPLVNAVESGPDGLAQLFLEMGYKLEIAELNAATGSLASLPRIFHDLETIVDNPERLLDLMDGIRALVGTTKNLNTIQQELGQRLLEYMLVVYIERYHGAVSGFMLLTGIIERTVIPPSGAIPEFKMRKIHWNRILELSNPGQLLSTLYGWATPTFDVDLLLTVLRDTMRFFGIPAFFRKVSDQDPDKYLFSGFDMGASRIGAKIASLPPAPAGASNAGLFIVPIGITTVDTSTDLDNGWSISIKIVASVDAGYGILIRPSHITYGPVDSSSGPAASFDAIVRLAKKSPPGKKIILLGRPDGIRLETTGFAVDLGIHPNQGEVKLEASSDSIQLIVDSSDSDGFIKKIFGDEPQFVEFSGAVIWSSKTGLHFRGHPGLKLVMPIDKTITAVKVSSLNVGIDTSQDGINTVIGLTGDTKIGPFMISVDNLGLKLTLKKISNGKPGLLGDYDLQFAYKPPDGLGLVVDAQGVKGGGYIWRSENQYVGVIDLNLRGFAVQAIAIIETRPEVSMFFAIFANFEPPIQLGGGWKINNIGGMIGFNRTVSHKDIASGIQSGILDSILFPSNVIQNAVRIIADLKKVFPPQEQQYIIGPAIRIAYGTPTLVTGDIAIILEFPNPFMISILGRITLKIPQEKPVVQLNLGILGAIDFTNQRIGVYGSLYNSRILNFTLSGDMAMSASWGTEKNFIFSIGGFNPRFSPPANFPPFGAPPLRRLGISFSSNLSIECYLALTSNTFQIGAKVDARFSGAGATIAGFLSFDALIQFSPLYYVVDVAGGFSVKYKGYSLLSIRFSGFLEGPNPYRIKGKASFSILFWDISLSVDQQFGSGTPPVVSLVDPWPQLKEAMGKNESWSADYPPWANLAVTIRESSKTEDILHPLGSLKVSQKVVPLNHTLSKFGAGDPESHFRFEIVGANSFSITNTIKDYFAPAQFSKYDNSQRLSLKSYDLMDAGVIFGLGTSDVSFDSNSLSYKKMEYETKMMTYEREGENKKNVKSLGTYTLNDFDAETFQVVGLARQTILRNNKRMQYNFQHLPKAVSILYEKYLIVDENLEPVKDSKIAGEFGQAGGLNKLHDFKKQNPKDRRNLQLISISEMKGTEI